jgi:putative holliday junction resolvase
MRRGVRIGVDLGEVRIGVARSDADGTLAVPLVTIPRGDGDIAALARIVEEWEALEVLIGLPLKMDGSEGSAAGRIREWVDGYRQAHPEHRVCLVDERLSTVQASADLRAAGRSSRRSRQIIDQAAAVVILESALARERSTGSAPGMQP